MKMHSFPIYITYYGYEKAKKTWAGAVQGVVHST